MQKQQRFFNLIVEPYWALALFVVEIINGLKHIYNILSIFSKTLNSISLIVYENTRGQADTQEIVNC